MDVVDRLAALVERLRPGARALVAVDGPDAAGKTTLARAVADRLDRPCVRVAVDDWHAPRAVRHRRGEHSPAGYYDDAFDHAALVRDCLQPFSAGAPQVRTAAFDLTADRAVDVRQAAPPDAVLLCEGVFLLRPELRGWWHLRTTLHVPEQVSLARGVRRAASRGADEQDARERYLQRYLPAQALYREAAAPHEHADVVLETSDPAQPQVLRWPD